MLPRLNPSIFFFSFSRAYHKANVYQLLQELGQDVIKLTDNGATKSNATFQGYALCEQDVPMTGEFADAEIVEMATKGGGGEDGGDVDEPPREVPTSAGTRNLRRLLRNKVACSGGDDWLTQCVKQLEDSLKARVRSQSRPALRSSSL